MRFERSLAIVLLVMAALAPAAQAQRNILVLPAGNLAHVEQADADLVMARANLQGALARGRATGTGAAIGGVAGLLVGVAYGLLITRPSSSPCDSDNCTRAGVTAVSGLIGAAAGVGLGAIVGSFIRKGESGPP